jgi:hypothetical protein
MCGKKVVTLTATTEKLKTTATKTHKQKDKQD